MHGGEHVKKGFTHLGRKFRSVEQTYPPRAQLGVSILWHYEASED